MAAREKIEIIEVPQGAFMQFGDANRTQGIVATIGMTPTVTLRHILEQTAASVGAGFLLILDEIEDPQNMGALIRTAECAGVHGVVTPKHHAAHVTDTVVKASAGATQHIPVAQVTNVVRAIEELKKSGFWIVGLDASGEKLYTDVDYSTPIALVIGNEARGIRRLVKENCDHLVKIPLFGKIQSLNASVAGALVMYEVIRSRKGPPHRPAEMP
jgi:23S rRNA (guanosine2251-2'-O)-methyltransferase